MSIKLIRKAQNEWVRRDELEAQGLSEDDIHEKMEKEGTLLPERVKDVLEQYQAAYNLRLGKNHDNEIEATAKAMKDRVGWMYSKLKASAEAGDLWTGENGEYEDVVEDLASGVDNTDKARWFAYLSDLSVTNEEEAQETLRMLKQLYEE
jgi:uncharacterized Ntn-hydrolase superfamily protein